MQALCDKLHSLHNLTAVPNMLSLIRLSQAGFHSLNLRAAPDRQFFTCKGSLPERQSSFLEYLEFASQGCTLLRSCMAQTMSAKGKAALWFGHGTCIPGFWVQFQMDILFSVNNIHYSVCMHICVRVCVYTLIHTHMRACRAKWKPPKPEHLGDSGAPLSPNIWDGDHS